MMRNKPSRRTLLLGSIAALPVLAGAQRAAAQTPKPPKANAEDATYAGEIVLMVASVEIASNALNTAIQDWNKNAALRARKKWQDDYVANIVRIQEQVSSIFRLDFSDKAASAHAYYLRYARYMELSCDFYAKIFDFGSLRGQTDNVNELVSRIKLARFNLSIANDKRDQIFP